MSDPLNVLIQQAFAALLLPDTSVALSDVTTPSTPVAIPFLQYKPTLGTVYLEMHPLMRSPTQHPSLGFDGSDITRGIFQVDAVIPDGKGEAPGARLAALVAARFKLGTSLVAGTYKLLVNKVPQIQAPVKDAAWVRYPVSVPYIVIT